MKKRIVFLAAGVLALSIGIYLSSKLWAQPAAMPPSHAQTHIGLVNLGYVIKTYKKVETFQGELKAYYVQNEDKMKKMASDLDNRNKQLAEPQWTTAQKEAITKEITKLKREMQDMTEDVKKYVNEKGEQQTVIIYKEIKEAASRYAVSKGLDMVVTYIDAVNDADVLNPINVMGKMQQRACMPLYYDMSLDVSKDIVTMLNGSYTAPAAAAPVTPAAPITPTGAVAPTTPR